MAPEIEDFLASLEDGEDQEQEPKAPVDPKRLGYALRQEQKSRKAMEKEMAELRTFQAQVLAEKRTSVLKAAGLNDFHAEAFSKFYEDVTPEAVGEYKVRAGLEAAPAEEEVPAAPEVVNPGFAPTSVGAPVPGKVYTREEWIALSRVDTAAAQRVFQEGKVNLSEL